MITSIPTPAPAVSSGTDPEHERGAEWTDPLPHPDAELAQEART